MTSEMEQAIAQREADMHKEQKQIHSRINDLLIAQATVQRIHGEMVAQYGEYQPGLASEAIRGLRQTHNKLRKSIRLMSSMPIANFKFSGDDNDN